jgi:arsenite-transporting ATPase
LVVNPERMVITETQRAYTYLCLYGYTVESIVVNRVLPEEAKDGYLSEKLEEQKKYIKIIDEAFSPLKTLKATLMPREIVGRKALEKLGDQLFGGGDPTEVYSKESPLKMYEEEDASVLAVKMPFPLNQKVELYMGKDDLVLQLGAFKKSIAMPYSLAKKKILGADLEDGWLKIRFEVEHVTKKKRGKKLGGRKAPGKTS